MTLEEARDWVMDNRDDGVPCPCCDQFAKTYRRKINSGNARALILAYRNSGLDWLHVPTAPGALSRQGGEVARLRYWGLIQEATEKREDGGRAGWWRITEPGERFVLGTVRVPKYARIYDSECLGLEGEPVSIRDALGHKFDYGELMRGE